MPNNDGRNKTSGASNLSPDNFIIRPSGNVYVSTKTVVSNANFRSSSRS